MKAGTKWTTLAVEKDIKGELDRVMIVLKKKLTYHEIIKELIASFDKNNKVT